MFTGNSFHSRGAAAPNAESPVHFFVMHWCSVGASSGVGARHAFVVEKFCQTRRSQTTDVFNGSLEVSK